MLEEKDQKLPLRLICACVMKFEPEFQPIILNIQSTTKPPWLGEHKSPAHLSFIIIDS